MISKLLCYLGFHRFTEPHQAREFESVCCTRCNRKWVVNTGNQKVFEVIR